MSQDELAVMDGGKCILQLRGVRPFLSDKYDITKHPNFKYTADANPRTLSTLKRSVRPAETQVQRGLRCLRGRDATGDE